MDQKTKDRLKLIPRAVCFKCKSKISYGNPMGKCFECGEKFCFDHLHCLQFKKGMSPYEDLKSVCEKCKIKHNYQTL